MADFLVADVKFADRLIWPFGDLTLFGAETSVPKPETVTRTGDRPSPPGGKVSSAETLDSGPFETVPKFATLSPQPGGLADGLQDAKHGEQQERQDEQGVDDRAVAEPFADPFSTVVQDQERQCQ
ncbi:hypothetical protein BH23PLA1_BH23PLA1_17330 [soil metagenome]